MKIIKWSIIMIGGVVFATISINAVDNIGNLSNSLLGSLVLPEKEKNRCPDDMVYVSDAEGGFCVDKYEASAGERCFYRNPQNKKETDENLGLPECKHLSVKGAIPWTNIARHQAELVCAKAGKRLPTGKEWYRSALGSIDKNGSWDNKDCNVDSVGSDTPDLTGSRELCKSSVGVYDMIGNVWEWTEETVYDGEYKGRRLSGKGYVKSIDSDGMVLETDLDEPDSAFFNDYFWINNEGARGIFRGGYWNSQSDAGQYTINIMTPPSFTGKAVGFRCVNEAK